jgi:hypothetical protein
MNFPELTLNGIVLVLTSHIRIVAMLLVFEGGIYSFKILWLLRVPAALTY